MDNHDVKLAGQLFYQDAPIPVLVTPVSKFSLLVDFVNGHEFIDQTEFNGLSVELDRNQHRFGKCVLNREPNIDGHAGRLLFIDDVYNFDIFINKKINVNLETFFYNLPLIMTHRDQVKTSFKEYTSNLAYDLSVYKQYFDNMDAEFWGESEMIKETIQKVIIESEGRKFMNFLDIKLDELTDQIRNFSREEHEQHGFYFRKLLWSYIMSSEFMARTNRKPWGYVGDSEMMKMIYENSYWGNTTFEKLMHKHPIEQPTAQAVRNRRQLIPRVLCETKSNFHDLPDRGFRILSVACGPAVELQDYLLLDCDFNKYSFTLLDQDKIALMEAARGIDRIEKIHKMKINVTYLQESVRTMLHASRLSKKWGRFHYIYSMGLFDYLTPPVASAVINKLFELLVPGGSLVIGNFHIYNASRYYMEYWCDWVLYYRTEEDMLNLLDAPNAEKSVSFEDTGNQMFLYVRKTGSD